MGQTVGLGSQSDRARLWVHLRTQDGEGTTTPGLAAFRVVETVHIRGTGIATTGDGGHTVSMQTKRHVGIRNNKAMAAFFIIDQRFSLMMPSR